jgi:hypothetical protein
MRIFDLVFKEYPLSVRLPSRRDTEHHYHPGEPFDSFHFFLDNLSTVSVLIRNTYVVVRVNVSYRDRRFGFANRRLV